MSMNLNVEAVVKVTLPSGKKRKVVERFKLVQTPTEVTYSILAIHEDNRLEAYLKWFESVFINEKSSEDRAYIREYRKTITKWFRDHPTKDGWKIEWFDS